MIGSNGAEDGVRGDGKLRIWGSAICRVIAWQRVRTKINYWRRPCSARKVVVARLLYSSKVEKEEHSDGPNLPYFCLDTGLCPRTLTNTTITRD